MTDVSKNKDSAVPWKGRSVSLFSAGMILFQSVESCLLRTWSEMFKKMQRLLQGMHISLSGCSLSGSQAGWAEGQTQESFLCGLINILTNQIGSMEVVEIIHKYTLKCMHIKKCTCNVPADRKVGPIIPPQRRGGREGDGISAYVTL